MNTKNIDKPIERIMSISWESDFSRSESQYALFCEFFRRMAKWTEFLGCREQWLFGNLANYVDSNLEIDRSKIDRLEQHLKNLGLHFLIIRVCINFVYWEMLEKRFSLMKESKLPEPYEPIILMFERGGIFDTEHGYFDLSGIGIPKPTWKSSYNNISEIKITPEELDRIDAEKK